MARKKEGDRKVADRPLSRNLDRLLSQSPGFAANLKRIKKELGMKPGTIRKWITGDRSPELEKLEKICSFFNFRISLIFEDPEILLRPGQQDLVESVRRIKRPEDIEKAKQILDVFIPPRKDNNTDQN